MKSEKQKEKELKNIKKVVEYKRKNPKISISELAKKFKLSRTTIYKYLQYDNNYILEKEEKNKARIEKERLKKEQEHIIMLGETIKNYWNIPDYCTKEKFLEKLKHFTNLILDCQRFREDNNL